MTNLRAHFPIPELTILLDSRVRIRENAAKSATNQCCIPVCLIKTAATKPGIPLRANIDETVLLVVITEQGENRNQCEEQ
jgi:hypothetical protein